MLVRPGGDLFSFLIASAHARFEQRLKVGAKRRELLLYWGSKHVDEISQEAHGSLFDGRSDRAGSCFGRFQALWDSSCTNLRIFCEKGPKSCCSLA